MKDYIIFIDDLGCHDVCLGWEGVRGNYKGVYGDQSPVFSSSFILEDGVLMVSVFDHNGYSYKKVDVIRVGKVLLHGYKFGLRHSAYAVGERSDLMKAVHVFGELRDSGNFEDVVMACCEMTAL